MDAIKRRKAFLAYAARLHELANAIETDEKDCPPVGYIDAEFMPVVVRMTILARDASTQCLNSMGFKREEVLEEFKTAERENQAVRILSLLKNALEQNPKQDKKEG